MEHVYRDIDFLVGNMDVLSNMEKTRALPMFSEDVVSFLGRLSEVLLRDPRAKAYGDIAAFAFWLRKASIKKEAAKYGASGRRIGWGMAFHIAPSNIPVQFAVSLVYALTAGNASVIRVSDKQFEQVDLLCETINMLLQEEFQKLHPYTCIVRYAHDNAATRVLSSLCDLRMIWGGDQTIAGIRSNLAQSRCVELGFADRYSIAVIDADTYLQKDPTIVARDFYLDTYYSDQNACSSTRLVLWIGDDIDRAKKIFWNSIQEKADQEYSLSDISGSEKLLQTAVLAAACPGIKEIRQNNGLVRIELPELFEDVMNYKGNCGNFLEYSLGSLDELACVLGKQCQTVTYLGDYLHDKIKELIFQQGLRGGDRIVPVGHSLDLSFVWDGYDMPLTLSRKINNQ